MSKTRGVIEAAGFTITGSGPVGSSGADVNLSNVTATSIPVDLLPTTDSSIDLGSSAKRMAEVHTDSLIMEDVKIVNATPSSWYVGTVPGVVLKATSTKELIIFGTEDSSDAAAPYVSVALKSGDNIGNSGGCTTQTGETFVRSGNADGAGASGLVSISSGTTVDGDTGNVIVATGIPSGSGAQGHIGLQAAASYIDMQALYALLPRKASDPSTTTEGACYYNTTSHVIKFYNGSVWKTVTTN